MTGYYSIHTHSKYSARDALPSVQQMVDRVVELGQPALGLTDHGNIAGIHELYRACSSAGIKAFPGVEAYVSLTSNISRQKTHHMGILAYNTTGWYNLIRLVNQSQEDFNYKPVLSVMRLSQYADRGWLDGLVVTTGCHFGVVNTALRSGGFGAAKNVVSALSDLFDGRVFVEIQHHNIVDVYHNELGIETALMLIADQLELPVVVTSDSHYVLPTDQGAHNTLKKYSSWSDDPDSAVFPGDGYHMCSEAEMVDRVGDEVMAAGLEGLGRLLELHDLHVDDLDHFKMKMPDLGLPEDSAVTLWQRCVNELVNRGLVTDRYTERLHEELELLDRLGFNDYLLLTAGLTDYMTDQGIMFNARGSASGSLACWLLGVTAVDPIRWKLRFDRFLSGERSKPPDIDLDVEHDRREEVIKWLDDRYATARIGTWRELKINDEHKGSLRIKRDQYMRKMGKNPDFVGPKEKKDMEALSAYRAYDGVGMHPAGVIVARDTSQTQILPKMWIASSKSMVTALDKNQVEAAGYLKLDLLGSRMMSTLRVAQTDGPAYSEIGFVDAEVMKRVRSGNTAGIFQLNGNSARIGCMQLQPTKFMDLVDAMALFRPAAQQSGATDEYLARRKGKKWEPLAPLIEETTKGTYGMMLYQEQMMGLLRAIGMSADELNVALKAIKSSNAATAQATIDMEVLAVKVDELTDALHWSSASKMWLIKAMSAYADYGFSINHALSYARIAFISAWYAVHRPVWFWTGTLTVAKPEDVDSLLVETVKHGVAMLPPDVNTSKLGYTGRPELMAVQKGLLSVSGVGPKAAKNIVATAPYTSLEDMAARVDPRAVTGTKNLLKGVQPASCGGVVSALYHENALGGLVFTQTNIDQIKEEPK